MQDNVLGFFSIYIIETALFVIQITIKKKNDNNNSSDPTNLNYICT